MPTPVTIAGAVDVLTPVTAGMLSQSGLINFVAAAAVDANTATQAWHTNTSVPGAWMQVDLGAGNARTIRIWRMFPIAAYAGIYDVEFSDDAITWRKSAVAFAPSTAGAWNKVAFEDFGPHRYWRILLTNTPGGGAYIGEIELREIPPIDLATLGFTVSDVPGWLDLPPRQFTNAPVLGRAGAKKLAPAAEQPRKLTLRGTMRAATAAATRANIDALKLALLADPLKLTFADHNDRYVQATLESFTAPLIVGPFVQENLQIEAGLTSYDPLTYDSARMSMGPGSGNRLLLGTGPGRPVVTHVGVATNPILTLRNSAGVAVSQMELTIGTIAGDVLEVDMDAKTIKKNGVSALSALTAGDFFIIDPIDQANFGGAGPYIDVANASGVVTTTFRRTWR